VSAASAASVASATVTASPAADRQAVAVRSLRGTRRRRRARWVTVTVLLAAAAFAVCVASLTLDSGYPVRSVLRALFSTDPGEADFVVNTLRLPRLALGILVGVAFALSGALFQSVLGNPLASPDVIGVAQGASAGAVVVVLGVGATGWPVSFAALAGGAVVAVLLYAVAWRGGMTGHRFVLAGIGVAYLGASVTGYLLTRAEVQRAQTALLWLAGSLSQYTWPLVGVLAVALLVLVPLVALTARRLDLLLLGDDQAAALGVRPELVRVWVIVLGTALACCATAAAGPIAFVALVAAPVARRLLGDGGLALLPAALVGVVLVVGADTVAQFVLPVDLAVPVGVVTGIVGGPYLIWLMVSGRSRHE
jgi:iron complex transport system permease protein